MKRSHRSDAPAPAKRRAVVHEWVDLKTIVLAWDRSRHPSKYHPPQGRCQGCLNGAGKGQAESVKRNAKTASNVKWLFVKSVIRTAQSKVGSLVQASTTSNKCSTGTATSTRYCVSIAH